MTKKTVEAPVVEEAVEAPVVAKEVKTVTVPQVPFAVEAPVVAEEVKTVTVPQVPFAVQPTGDKAVSITSAPLVDLGNGTFVQNFGKGW